MRYMSTGVAILKGVVAGTSHLVNTASPEIIASVFKAAVIAAGEVVHLVDDYYAREDEREREQKIQDRPNQDRFMRIEQQVRELRQAVVDLCNTRTRK